MHHKVKFNKRIDSKQQSRDVVGKQSIVVGVDEMILSGEASVEYIFPKGYYLRTGS